MDGLPPRLKSSELPVFVSFSLKPDKKLWIKFFFVIQGLTEFKYRKNKTFSKHTFFLQFFQVLVLVTTEPKVVQMGSTSWPPEQSPEKDLTNGPPAVKMLYSSILG